MKVGVFVVSRSSSGGMYQYTQQILRSLREHADDVEFVVFKTAKDPAIDEVCAGQGQAVRLRSYELLRALATRLPSGGQSLGNKRGAGRLRRWLGKYVLARAGTRYGIDLMVFPTPCPEAATCGIPFVVSIHDIQHRLQPEFPEVSANGEAARREVMYRAAIMGAAAILVDSQESRNDIVRYYAADPSRVHSLPFVSPPSVAHGVTEEDVRAVRKKYELPASYAFYPAQFWPHKNHLRLIEAVARTPGLSLVLTGTADVPFSTFAAVKRHIARHLPERARLLGYVPQQDIGPLYVAASMLAMPTFFGPTNIPIVEAFGLGVPVVTSDLPGVREQVGDAALLIDPRSIESLADALGRVFREPELRKQLIDRGRLRRDEWTSSKFADRLLEILRATVSKTHGDRPEPVELEYISRAPERSRGAVHDAPDAAAPPVPGVDSSSCNNAVTLGGRSASSSKKVVPPGVS